MRRESRRQDGGCAEVGACSSRPRPIGIPGAPPTDHHVRSSALSTRLDPEEQREVVSAFQSCCAADIKRLGGMVAQYLDDGVLAYFGYPAAHEDDAERAVRAGLAILVPGIRSE
jgi:hypothetical protein